MSSLFNSVDLLSDAMTFNRDRHTVLASNLANIDTPGYKPLDLERSMPFAPGEVGLLATERGHLEIPIQTMSEMVTQAAGAESNDGNAVSLEQEMAKIHANQVRYATASELVSRRLALLRYTAGDGSGS